MICSTPHSSIIDFDFKGFKDFDLKVKFKVKVNIFVKKYCIFCGEKLSLKGGDG
jgi:hypothetical protein